jgi:hypothetical protein
VLIRIDGMASDAPQVQKMLARKITPVTAGILNVKGRPAASAAMGPKPGRRPKTMPKRVPKPIERILMGLKTAARPDSQLLKAKNSMITSLQERSGQELPEDPGRQP